MYLISIVLPTYNGEKYITQAIESCLNQTYTNIELIIVNDCSTDNTLSIIESFAAKDHRIQIISNNENRKLPRSLNLGFAVARGEYFTWTSDDNYYAPDALEKMAKELDANKKVDIVYSSYQFIDERGSVLEYFGNRPEHLLFKCIVGACFLYRRTVHEFLNGYAEDKFRMEDMDFWLRASGNFKFHFIDERNLYFYRKHTGSLTFDIYGSDNLFNTYRQNYADSFRRFFNIVLNADFSDDELKIHMEIFFEDLLREKNWEFGLGEQVNIIIDYLDKLAALSWERVGFDTTAVKTLLNEKRRHLVSLVINDLIFDNKTLSKKSPALARHTGKPISWYYQEYEVLPSWYKKLGHVIKLLQGNRSLRSFKNIQSPK